MLLIILLFDKKKNIKVFKNIFTIPFDTYLPENITLLFLEKKRMIQKVKKLEVVVAAILTESHFHTSIPINEPTEAEAKVPTLNFDILCISIAPHLR